MAEEGVISVAVIPGQLEDEVWLAVSRKVNGVIQRYIEQVQPRAFASGEDAYYVDCGLSYIGEPTNVLANLDHLEGETVAVLGNGKFVGLFVVEDGAITIPVEVTKAHVGLPFTAKLETLPLVVDPQDRAANKKVKTIDFDFYKTGDCMYGNGANSELENINFEGDELYTSTVDFKHCMWVYGGMKKQTIYLESDKPLPLCVRAIIPNYDIHGS